MARSGQSDRAFGLMFAGVCAAIAAVGWLVFDVVLVWVAALAAAFLATALLVPGVLLPLNRLWGVIAHRLGQLSNAVLLGLFFFLFVLPMGLLLRLLGRDPMQRRLRSEEGTYWTPVVRQASKETFQDLF
jgi:hypothetical protein